MLLRSVATWAWFAIGLLCPLTPRAEDIRDAFPGETISHYLGLDLANITENAEFLTSKPLDGDNDDTPKEPADANSTGQLNPRDSSHSVPWKPSPILGKPSLSQPPQRSLSATYNGTEERGYNITIPGCTPADTVLGDWEAPSGDLIENCTLAQMAQKLLLPPKMLQSFTQSRAQGLLDKLNSSLQSGICEPPLEPPDRELKANPQRFRFNPDTQSGYFSSLLLVLLGSFGVSFTGLHLGIIHEGVTANITLTTEVLILSSFATFGTMCVIIIERERRRLAHAEAVVLNAFLYLIEKVWGELHSSVQCVPEVPLAQGVQTLVQKLTEGARVLVTEDVQATAMKTAGSSSVNLVSAADIENQLANVQSKGQC